jgi:hypothetical protein
VANASGFSRSSEFERVMSAARAPGWSLGLDRHGQIMATRDSGRIGLPWVVRATRSGRGLRVESFQPGDDTDAEGAVVALIAGNPREMGRQLREILGELAASDNEIVD